MYQFILLPIEGHLGYFHFLKIMNNTTINIHEQVFMWTQFEKIPFMNTFMKIPLRKIFI